MPNHTIFIFWIVLLIILNGIELNDKVSGLPNSLTDFSPPIHISKLFFLKKIPIKVSLNTLATASMLSTKSDTIC